MYPSLEMSQPSKAQLAMQVELHRVEEARKLEEEEFKSQKRLLQMQLQAEVRAPGGSTVCAMQLG